MLGILPAISIGILKLNLLLKALWYEPPLEAVVCMEEVRRGKDNQANNPPCFSVHEILQAKILEWVAMPSSRGSSNPGIKPASLISLALAGWFFVTSATCEALRSPVQCSSVQSLSRVWLCDPMDCSMPGFPVHHQLPELTQTQVHWVGDAIQPSHPQSSPSPPALNLSQNRGLFPMIFLVFQWYS